MTAQTPDELPVTPRHGPHVGTETAAARLMRSLDYRLSPGTEPLDEAQVAVVLHALADHTAIMAALGYQRDMLSPWPEALSIGRWHHDVADQLEQLHREHARTAKTSETRE